MIEISLPLFCIENPELSDDLRAFKIIERKIQSPYRLLYDQPPPKYAITVEFEDGKQFYYLVNMLGAYIKSSHEYIYEYELIKCRYNNYTNGAKAGIIEMKVPIINGKLRFDESIKKG